MPIADRATFQPRRSLLERFRPALTFFSRGAKHYFVPTGLWRIAGLGSQRTPAFAKPWPRRLTRSAAGTNRRRSAAGAKTALSGFYQEGAAIPNPVRLFVRRDIDGYDAICDHLMVLDHSARDRSAPTRPTVVGTYRLLRQPLAEECGGFYTASEFDISSLIARHNNLQFLELGRSCVLGPYRNKHTVELLWHGIHCTSSRTIAM